MFNKTISHFTNTKFAYAYPLEAPLYYSKLSDITCDWLAHGNSLRNAGRENTKSLARDNQTNG